MRKDIDVFGLGNALVDLEYLVDDTYLSQQDIAKGHMTLVEEDRLAQLIDSLSDLAPKKRCSGGSAANTIYAVQAFGGSTYYGCRVAGDSTGAFFLSDLASCGVQTIPHDPDVDGASGRCLVLITDDAERSMNTCLAISTNLSRSIVDEDALRRAERCYVEGYLASSESSTDATRYAFDIAADNNVQTSLSLSDPSMVEFCRDGLETMLGNGVDILFCNEEEALTWSRTDRLDIAMNELKDIGRSCFVTLGARGSVFAEGGSRSEASSEAVKAVDSNGAGDIYAGGALWALGAGYSGVEAARFGNFAAGKLVQRFGARLETPQEYQDLKRAFPATV